MSKILYTNNNDFHNLGRSQMCAGGCCYFRSSKPHSGTLWVVFYYLICYNVKTLATSPHVKIFSYHVSTEWCCRVRHWEFEASWWQLVWTSPTNPSIIQTLALSFKCFWVHWSWGTDILLLDLHQNLDVIPPSYPLVNRSPSIRFTYIEHFNILSYCFYRTR